MKRSKTNTYYNFNAPTVEELDPVSKKIYDGYVMVKTKRYFRISIKYQ